MTNEGPFDNALRATLAISPQEAQNGTERTLTLPGGRQVLLRVPPHAYSGQELRLPGQGEATAGGAGDLIITLTVTTEQPSRHATTDGADPNAATVISRQSSAFPPPVTTPSYPGFSYSDSTAPDYIPPPAPPQTLPPYQPAPTPKRQRGNRTALILLIGLAVLLLVGGSVLTYLLVIVPNNPSTDPTAVARQNATGTAQAQDTATAQAEATSQARATATAATIATATATVTASQMNEYKQATSGKPSLNDSLQKQSATDWDTNDNCFFSGNAYHATSKQKNYFHYCSSNKTNYGDFALQVHFKMIEGDYAGFIFRANNDYNQYYLFIVGKSKEFALYFYDDNADDKSIIIERSNSDLLKGGTDQENIVGVIARGNTFKLYFNNQYAKTLTDQKNRLTGAGHLGFIALDNGSETEVAYTQAQVWQL